MKKRLLILFLIIPSIQMGYAQAHFDSLNLSLEALWQRSNLPGFAVAIVRKDSVVYQQGFGWADRERKTPYTPQTIQNIGSVSKTLIGVALMQLVQQGKLSLDTEINTRLPFPVVNPYAPDKPILVRHLATHTAGIADSRMYEKSYYLRAPATPFNPAIAKKDRQYLSKIFNNQNRALGDYLRDYLRPGGQFYQPKNFNQSAPGSRYQYTNVGATLAAYLVEVVSGQPYHQYTQSQILDKIPMVSSGWRQTDIDSSAHATLYFANQAPVPPYALVTYPDGGLLTNCHDLALYLREMMRATTAKVNCSQPQHSKK
ncbi:MAG: beta-lactamase family protein [Bacteroidia bacterium]|nr:beta-lactamase family protein [Bacteroidia bacterium]